MSNLRLLDTFAGIGGFSYAAEKLVGGFETTQFIEINPFCQKVLYKHWSHVPIHDDITTFTATPRQFDIITGGFPCQDISNAGLQKGITKDTRSGLFYELIRIIRMVRPKYLVLENVAAITNRGLDIVLRELHESGYNAEWSVISASALGACHQRARFWLVAYPNSKQSSRTKSEIQTRRNSTSSSNRPRNVTNTKSKSSDGSELRSSFNKKSSVSKLRDCNIQSSNPNSEGLQRLRGEYELQESCKERTFTWRNSGITLNPNWKGYKSKPTLCRGDDGLFNRVDRLKALGNSIVPAVAAIPLQRVLDLQSITTEH